LVLHLELPSDMEHGLFQTKKPWSTCRESAETIVLLEAILGGLSDEKSGAKRELCASAAREFLLWSAKHIPMPKAKEGGVSNASASSNLNAASLLRRLFERLAHPEAYQR
jgi:DNA-dependent protein kinase catalytic subunit